MPYLNECTIMGNLTKAPELRYTPSGSPVCEMTIAVNRKSREREEVCYIDAVAWGKAAENCQRYLTKGSCVLVKGYLKQESWDDRNGGGKRSKLRIVAENIQFISTPRNGESHAQGAPQEEYAPPASPPAREPGRPAHGFYGYEPPAQTQPPETTSTDSGTGEPSQVRDTAGPEDDIPF